MGYNAWLDSMAAIGLERARDYDYLDKPANIASMTQYMLARTNIMFRWHGLPDTVPEDQFEKMLQTQGYAIWGNIDGKPYACYGGLGGRLDEYYRPTQAIVAIPYLDYNGTWDIGADCVIVKNDLMMQGLLPLYAKYCTLLNEAEISLLLSLVNQRIQAYLTATDDQTYESAKDFLKQIFEGRQGVIAENALFDSLKVKEVKSGTTFSQNNLIETLQYLRSELYHEIGLASLNTIKKERISNAEYELNTDSLYPFVDDMLQCRRDGCEQVNAMFGTGIEVELNSSWDYRIYNGMSIRNTKPEIPLEEVKENFEENEMDRDDGTVDGDSQMDTPDEIGNEDVNLQAQAQPDTVETATEPGADELESDITDDDQRIKTDNI